MLQLRGVGDLRGPSDALRVKERLRVRARRSNRRSHGDTREDLQDSRLSQNTTLRRRRRLGDVAGIHSMSHIANMR